MEVPFEGTRDFGRSAGARAVDKATGTFMGKAMDPCAEGGISKREGGGDCLQAGAFDDFTDRLGAPEDAGLFRLLQHRIQSRESVIGKVEMEGPHGIALPYKGLNKYDHRSRYWVAILFPQQHLFNSNFPGAASTGSGLRHVQGNEGQKVVLPRM